MTEGTPGTTYSRASEEKESIRSETMADGRYIPYSGGIMTWFENRGVLKCEQPNKYRFHEMIDADSIRIKLFERWGGGENISRRVSERQSVGRPIHIVLTTSSGAAIPSTAKDYSSHGLRLQLTNAGQVNLTKGDTIRTVIYDNPQSGQILFDIASQVMWANQVGKTQETLSIGIAFMDLSMDRRKALLEHFRR